MNDNEKGGNNLAEIKPLPEGMKLGKVTIVLSEKWDEHRGAIVENVAIDSEFENDANGHVVIRSNVYGLGATIKTLIETGTIHSMIGIIMSSWADTGATTKVSAPNEATPA